MEHVTGLLAYWSEVPPAHEGIALLATGLCGWKPSVVSPSAPAEVSFQESSPDEIAAFVAAARR